MSRPLRIEYQGAWYHVMNRGGGYRDIFKEAKHQKMFLDLLREITEMFGVEIHAYCLMGNHYHLLVHTPKGNLGRAMRHLGGVYTQRFNSLEKTDGQLFRGRYKAILVEDSSYLLCVSRYIHLNPVNAEVVDSLEKYSWSSYGAFIGNDIVPKWLVVKKILGMIGSQNVKFQYKSFVVQGLDEKTAQFYGKKKQRSIFGSDSFIAEIGKNKIVPERETPESKDQLLNLSVDDVVTKVASIVNVDSHILLNSIKGRVEANNNRNMTIYICRRHFGFSLSEISKTFSMGHYSSVSSVVTRFASLLEKDKKMRCQVNNVINIMMTKAKT